MLLTYLKITYSQKKQKYFYEVHKKFCFFKYNVPELLRLISFFLTLKNKQLTLLNSSLAS